LDEGRDIVVSGVGGVLDVSGWLDESRDFVVRVHGGEFRWWVEWD
jgi:hypothetical protein